MFIFVCCVCVCQHCIVHAATVACRLTVTVARYVGVRAVMLPDHADQKKNKEDAKEKLSLACRFSLCWIAMDPCVWVANTRKVCMPSVAMYVALPPMLTKADTGDACDNAFDLCRNCGRMHFAHDAACDATAAPPGLPYLACVAGLDINKCNSSPFPASITHVGSPHFGKMLS